MRCTRAFLLAVLSTLLWASSVEAGWGRKGPSQAFLLFSNTRWGSCRQARFAPQPPRAAAAAPAAAALAHRSQLLAPRSARSAFDGLDQPNWRQRLERDVLPVLRRSYNLDAPLPGVPVSDGSSAESEST